MNEAIPHLSWTQALSWRLQRHHLINPAPGSEMLRVASDICGLHAQLMSSAELSLWARSTGLQRDTLSEALWERRELVKLWAIRGTLHLLPATDLGLWTAAFSTYTERGMTGHPEIDMLCEAIGKAVDGRLLTREALANEVERCTGSRELAEMVRFSWGSYMKPAAFRGRLCFGPSQGSNVTFTSPATWLLGGIEMPDATEALREVTRRYLSAYAPATAADLALWWGGYGPARGRRMLAALGDEAMEVDLEGQPAWVLARDLSEMQNVSPTNTAHLLPAFDPWVIGASRTASALLDPAHKARVYRPQGWISPVLLVNGRMAGVWKQAQKKDRLTVTIEPFEPLPAWAWLQTEAEAQRLAMFLACDLELRIAG